MRTSVIAVMVLGIGVGLQADDKPAAAPDPAAIEKMMLEMAKVGPQHEEFKRWVGEWKTTASDYSAGTDKPAVTHGTSTFELLMDGRYLKETFRGEFGGKPFEGLGLTGYDNSQKKYVGCWIDSMSTGIMRTEGTIEEKTGVATNFGEVVTPLGTMKMKMVSEPRGKDAMTFTMYMLGPDGGETKQMVIEYNRKS